MFFRWLRQLFTGEPACRHEYETIYQAESRVVDEFGDTIRFKWYYHLRCNHCGYICKRVL